MPRPPRKVFEVYSFIETYKEEHDGNSPTYEIISTHFGWVSETTAYWAVQKLASMGWLRLDEKRQITLDGEYTPPPSPRR